MASKKSELPKKPAESIQAAVTPAAEAMTVALSGSCIGTSSKTFEELITGAFIAALTGGNKTNGQLSDISSFAGAGIINVLNSQTSLLEEIKNSLEKIVNKVASVKTDAPSSILNLMNKTGIPVVIVGNYQEEDKFKGSDSTLEIILNADTYENLNEFIKDVAKLGKEKILDDFEKSLKRITDSLEKVDKQAKNLENLAGVFNGFAELNKLDVQKLDEFILFIEDLGGMVNVTQTLPTVTSNIFEAMNNLLPLTKSVDNAIYVTDCLTEVFWNLLIVDHLIPEFNLKSIELVNAAIGDTKSGLNKIVSSLVENEKNYKTAHNSAIELTSITARLLFVGLMSNMFTKFDEKNIEPLSGWLTKFNEVALQLSKADGHGGKGSRKLSTTKKTVIDLADLVSSIVTLGKVSNKIPEFDPEKWTKINEFIKKLSDAEDKESLIGIITSAKFDEKTIQTAKKNLDGLKSIVVDVFLLGLFSILLLPLAPLAIGGMLALTLFTKVANGLIASLSGKDISTGIKQAQINLEGIGGLLIASTLCMLIGAYFVTKNPTLILGALGFGLVLGLFLFTVVSSVGLGLRLMKSVGGVKGLNDIAVFVSICGVILLLGGVIMAAFPRAIIASFAFALSLGLFLTLVIGAVSIAGKFASSLGEKYVTALMDLIAGATLVMLVGALLFMVAPQVLWAAMKFAVFLGVFLAIVVLAITVPAKLCKQAAADIQHLHKLIIASSIILLVGGLLVMNFPWLILSSLAFGVILGGFIFLVLKAITSQTKKIRRAEKEIWSIIAIIGASSLILLIAGGLIVANPWMAASIPGFIACMTGLFLALAWVAERLSDKQAKITKGIIVMGLITVVAMLAVIPIKMLANAIKGVDLLHLLAASGIMVLVLLAIGGLSMAAGSLITGPQAILFGAGIVVLGAISTVAILASAALMMIAKTIEVFTRLDFEKIKFGGIIKAIGTYIVMIGMMIPIAALSIPVGLASPAIMMASASIMVISASLKMMANLPDISPDKIRSRMQAFMDMALGLVPLGRPSIAVQIVLASAAASSLRWAISNIAAGVQEMASLKIPIYEGTKTVGYRQLNNSDFKLASRNISLIVSTLGDTMINLYNTRPDIFKPNLLTGKTPFSIVCSSVSKLGSVISQIAWGVQSYASLKIPEYKGEKIVGYKELTNDDFKNAANNVSLIVTTLAEALIDLYVKNPLMFLGNSNDTPLNRVIKSSKELGKAMSNIALGVQAWADLKAPIDWNSEGKPIKFENLKKGFELDAATNVSTIVSCLFDTLTSIHDANPQLFKGSKNTPVNIVIKSARDLGKVLSGLAQGIQAWANMMIPTEWNNEGKPIKFKQVTNDDATNAGNNAASIITTLFDALTRVYDLNPDMFKGKNNKINKVVNVAKEIGEMTAGLAKGVQKMAVMTFVSEYDSKTGKPLKTVKVSNEEVKEAGENIGTIITSLFTSLNTVYNQNPAFFSEGEDSMVFTVVKSVKNVSGAISGIARAVKMIATTQVPIDWDKDGKPIAFEKLDQKHFDLASNGVAKIVSTLGGAILDLVKNPETAKYFETEDGDGPFARVLNSVKDLGKLVGNMADGIKKYSELKIPQYDAQGKIIGYKSLIDDDFKNAGTNVGLIVSTLAESLSSTYKMNPEWFDEKMLTTILDSSRNMGEVIGVIAESVAAIASLSIPIAWDKSGKPINFKPMKPEDFTQAATNVETIITTLGDAMTKMYNEKQDMFKPIDPNNPNGDTPFEKVALSCLTLGEMIKNVAEGIEYFGNIWGKKLPNGGTINKNTIKAAGDNIAEIITSLGTAIATVYKGNESMFELPPIQNVTKTKGWFKNTETVTYSPNPSDPPFLKVIKSCGAMGQLLVDLAAGINEFANIYSKKLPDGSTLDLSAAGKNIGDIISCVGNAVVTVYKDNEHLFDSRRNGSSPFAIVTNGILNMVSGLSGLAKMIGSYASGEFPLVIDKDGNVKSKIKINFATDSEKITSNIKSLITCLFTAVSTANNMPNVSTDIFDRLKVHGQNISESMKVLSDMVVSYASLKIPTGFDKNGKILGYKQLDSNVFKDASASMVEIVNGVTNVLTTALKFVNTNNLLGKTSSEKLNASLGEIVKTIRVMNKRFEEIIKEVLKCPDPSNLVFTKIEGFIEKTEKLSSILKPIIMGKEVTTPKKGFLGFKRKETTIVTSEIMQLDTKQIKKFLKALSSLSSSVQHIIAEAKFLDKEFANMPDLSNVNTSLVSTYLTKSNDFASKLNNHTIEKIKINHLEKIFENADIINANTNIIGAKSNVFAEAFNTIYDTSKLNLSILETYFKSLNNVANEIRKAHPTTRIQNIETIIKDLNGITEICTGAVKNSESLKNSIGKIKNTSDIEYGLLNSYFYTLGYINSSLALIQFGIFNKDIDISKEISSIISIVENAPAQSVSLVNALKNLPNEENLEVDLLDNYFDKCIKIAKILSKNVKKLNKQNIENLKGNDVKYILNELEDVYRFGNALTDKDVSGNYDNVIEAVEKISKATGKDIDDKRLDKFKKQNKELEKFVKTVNSINVYSTDKLTQLLSEFNKLGLNMTNMEKLVEAITMHLSKELFNLSEELDKVGKVIAKESDRKEKRKRIVEKSVEDVKDLINRELTVVVKKEQTSTSSSSSSNGGSGYDNSDSGNGSNITVKGENVTVQGYKRGGGAGSGINH